MGRRRRAPSQFTTNHTAAALSELDLRMIRSVPPGGNWKDIPTSIPSRRLAQIRESYKNGEGSRSTYYGRLHWERPAYTISTYFNRPGNGCYVHPSADRLITVREAARFQSFPDWYHFYGTRTSIYKQVGNAVPPLLAFVLARSLGVKDFIDLFCGTGGLSLGFEEAGAVPIIAADIDAEFCETYLRNREPDPPLVVREDLSSERSKDKVVALVSELGGDPDAVIGGPPCQGFSHAGNARSPSDPRNLLVFHFLELVRRLKPRIVLMENVPGILSLRDGRVLGEILRRFAEIGYPAKVYFLRAEAFGVPQRRKRVFIVGSNEGSDYALPAGSSEEEGVFTVADAISDLPQQPAKLPEHRVGYSTLPRGTFEAFVRGHIGFEEFIGKMGLVRNELNARQLRLPVG